MINRQMNSIRLWIFGFFVSCCIHFFIFWIVFYNKDIVLSDSLNAKQGDKFESIMIVSNLPIGELKQTSPNLIKGQKTEEKTEEKENKNEKNIQKNKKKKEPKKIKSNVLQDSEMKVSKKNNKNQEEKQKQNSNFAKKEIPQNNTNSPVNSSMQDNVATAPIKGSGKNVTTPLPGSSNLKSTQISWQGLVFSRLNKFKRYPNQALIDKQEGIIKVKVTLDKDGNVIDKLISNPCKYDILNKEALELFDRASPFPKPPKEFLKNQIVRFEIPIEFNIKKYKKTKF
ncbi:MAG: energy transducer TonB [Campylobacter sputorum]|uniref:energy transducer TonB family protein n=2 Tax=Campylobacter sputorum TaxID=206 RepID=UPI001E2DF0AA|nr:energy transducer TonB [Campylobacter sputorum]MDY6119951.1 energy transducer TonB [Campylobacter sputorum]